MDDNNAEQEGSQAGNGFWKQFVMAVAVVAVVLIGAWQVFTAVKAGTNSAPSAAANVPASASGSTNGVAADVVSANGNPASVAPTSTALPVKSVVLVDTTQWFLLTNESLGPGFALALDPATKQPVMAAADGTKGQAWKFTRTAFGFYSMSTEAAMSALVLNVQADSGYPVGMKSPKYTNTDADWKPFTFGTACDRLTTQWLGESWSLDLQGKGPALQMTHSNFGASQCWHLTPTGPIH